MNQPRVRNNHRRLIGLVLAAMVGSAGPSAATIRFELPQLQAPIGLSGTATGELDVVVRADAADLPATIASFNVDFSADAVGLVFDDAAAPPNPLLPVGSPLNFALDDRTVRAAQDVFAQEPNAYALADGLGLIRVPFEIAADAAGTVFTLSFGTINELAGPNGVPLQVDVSDTGSITAFLAGDYNRDGAVDAADYTVWRDDSDEVVDPFLGADGDGDGVIDADDYQVWRTNFGRSVAPAGLAIPEPATFSGAFLLLTASLARQSRRNH